MVGGIILAAGASERMGETDKMWVQLAPLDAPAMPLVSYAISAYEAAAVIDRVVLVVAPHALVRARALVEERAFTKVSSVVAGGARRRDSVLRGIEAMDGVGWVSIHDGARPLVTPELIESGVEEARETGASCCAVPASDTVKEADSGYVMRTLDRARIWLAQTPQTFRRDLLLAAHRFSNGDVTDDAILVEAAGGTVRLYPGARRNVKVTTPEDLAIVEALMR
jgi:2-C-methyl-D-erythritol 4-phosphate cytidylyltransferase